MKYDVVYEKKAVKSFAKLDKGQQNMIAAWIEKNLVQTDNPRKHGKAKRGDGDHNYNAAKRFYETAEKANKKAEEF